MNKSAPLFIIATVLLLFAAELDAQWKQVNAGPPGTTWAVAVIGSNVFAGTPGGIFKSTDNGASWTNVSGAYTLCFAAKGPYIFAGTPMGIIRSSDGGSTWIVPDSSMITQYIDAMAANDSVLYAGGSGIFRSTDNGASWTVIENGLVTSQTGVYGLAANNSNVFAATFNGVVESSNGGDRWFTVWDSGSIVSCVAVNGSTVLTGGGYNANSFKSTDNGRTWTAMGGSNFWSLTIDSPYAYAGTESGVLRSTDNGETWSVADSGAPGGQVWAVAASDSNVYACTSNGMFASSNRGTSWTSANNGIGCSTVYSIDGNGPDVFSVMGGNPLLFVSTDYGTTWTEDTTLPPKGAASVSVIGSNVFAGTNQGLFKSSDNGQSWTSINGGVMDSTYPVLHIVKSGLNLVAATRYGVFLSSDDGTSWTQVSYTGWNNSYGGPPQIASLVASGSNIFAGGDFALTRSTDNGETWTALPDSLVYINALALSGSSIFAGRYTWSLPAFDRPYPGGLFRSTDNGSSWIPDTSGLSTGQQVYSLAIHGSDVFAGLWPGVYTSTLNGNMWGSVGDGLPAWPVLQIYVNDSSVFAGAEEGGIWQRPLSQVTGFKQKTTFRPPTVFRLDQNYPNPFNPSTMISYQLSAVSYVTLKVFDVLGREVTTLVNEVKNPGNYEVKFDGSRFASGVYFYRLEATSKDGHDFVSTKKLMVIK